ncbi:ABC transporter G family member 32, partial [Mucuna pruriens]
MRYRDSRSEEFTNNEYFHNFLLHIPSFPLRKAIPAILFLERNLLAARYPSALSHSTSRRYRRHLREHAAVVEVLDLLRNETIALQVQPRDCSPPLIFPPLVLCLREEGDDGVGDGEDQERDDDEGERKVREDPGEEEVLSLNFFITNLRKLVPSLSKRISDPELVFSFLSTQERSLFLQPSTPLCPMKIRAINEELGDNDEDDQAVVQKKDAKCRNATTYIETCTPRVESPRFACRKAAEHVDTLCGLCWADWNRIVFGLVLLAVTQVFRMTLLLGPPSSGKTTLMLALAVKFDPKLKVRTLKKIMQLLDQFSRKVTSNGHGMNELVPQGTVVYVNHNDLIGEKTARETLSFSARVQGVGPGHKCGWPPPNSHLSSEHRRLHACIRKYVKPLKITFLMVIPRHKLCETSGK